MMFRICAVRRLTESEGICKNLSTSLSIGWVLRFGALHDGGGRARELLDVALLSLMDVERVVFGMSIESGEMGSLCFNPGLNPGVFECFSTGKTVYNDLWLIRGEECFVSVRPSNKPSTLSSSESGIAIAFTARLVDGSVCFFFLDGGISFFDALRGGLVEIFWSDSNDLSGTKGERALRPWSPVESRSDVYSSLFLFFPRLSAGSPLDAASSVHNRRGSSNSSPVSDDGLMRSKSSVKSIVSMSVVEDGISSFRFGRMGVVIRSFGSRKEEGTLGDSL